MSENTTTSVNADEIPSLDFDKIKPSLQTLKIGLDKAVQNGAFDMDVASSLKTIYDVICEMFQVAERYQLQRNNADTNTEEIKIYDFTKIQQLLVALKVRLDQAAQHGAYNLSEAAVLKNVLDVVIQIIQIAEKYQLPRARELLSRQKELENNSVQIDSTPSLDDIVINE
jgi:hypothetical protein